MPGDGDCRVADCLALLLDHGYRGTWSIEPHVRVRPHEHRTGTGPDGAALFVAYGRRLEHLVDTTVASRTRGGRSGGDT